VDFLTLGDRSVAASTPVHCVHLRPRAPPAHAPLTLGSSSIYNVLADPNWIGDQKSIMHPTVTIITVILCVAFCLRPTEFDPARIVSRSFNAVSRRRKK
jgi:hypothetical protein